MADKFISLLRVSTTRQGESGLGLEAQRQQVLSHVQRVQGNLITEFVEVESGRKLQRPMLEEAIALAKAYNATLIIAKWDRISRDAHYLLGLQKSGVKLVAADNPNANELTIGILAVVAQDEAMRISDRVTKALAAAKARGQVLGAYDKEDKTRFIGRTGTKADCLKAAAAKKTYANDKAQNYQPLLDRINPARDMSMNALAKVLNEEQVPTPSGKGQWQHVQVARVYKRLEAA
jgi:DNA invertase Pin-like site-specific DNA recombinase